MCGATKRIQNSKTGTLRFPSLQFSHSSPMSSSAAGDPSPPPPAAAAERPGGWLSGLVSGAGRLLAAVLGPDSPDSSSSPESSQSPPPPRGSGDHVNATHFPSDNYQSGKEIVLKDCGEGSLAVVSEIDPKDAIMQLLTQETYSRSECYTLIKIIQERVVDSDPGVVEPAVVLPIAWQAGPQQDPVAYSSFSPNTYPPTTSSVPAYSQEFDNSVVEEKRWLDMKRSTPVEGPCTLNTDRSQLVDKTLLDLREGIFFELDLKRSYSDTGDTLDESRRVRPKLNGLNISKKQVDVLRSRAAIASFEESTSKDPNAFRGIPVDSRKLFTDTPLLGTDNLTFSNIVSNGDTANDTIGLHGKPPAVTTQPFDSASCQADWDNHDSTMFYRYSEWDLTKAFPIKLEPLDGLVPLEPDMMDLAEKNHDMHTIGDDSGSVSKLMFQEDIEGAPSSSMGLQQENSSTNCTRGANLQRSTPTKRRSPVTNVYRRQNNGNTIRSENGLLQQGDPKSVGQEADLGHIQAKRPVGRPRKTRRSRKARRLLL